MRFAPLDIAGAVLVRPEPITDDRGAFTRILCKEELGAAGLITDFRQSSMSSNDRAGTLRGMLLDRGPW